jgi:hypothetical protein
LADPEDLREALKVQLNELRARVDDETDRSTLVLVYIPNPALGVVGGLCTINIRSAITVGDFRQEIEQWPSTWSDVRLVRSTTVAVELPAGHAEGVQVLLAMPATEPDAGQDLQERLALGIFPDDTSDMIEAICIAAYLGAFTDIRAQVVNLLASLQVHYA